MTDSRRTRFHTYGAVRTVLIGYGVAAFSYLLMRTAPEASTESAGGNTWSLALVLGGMGLQLLRMAGRALGGRLVADRSAANKSLAISELVGDGITVLFFGLATFGAIPHRIDAI